MIILFKNILFVKDFLACHGCFGLFTTIKKGSGTSSWSTFSAWFFHKSVPYLIICQLIKSYLLCFLKDQTKCVKFLFRQVIMSQTLRFIFHHPFWQRKKEGRKEIQKFKYLENKKSFFDEINSHTSKKG